MTVTDALVKCLEKHGVKYIFGVPGGALEPINCSLAKSNIKVILAKHEEGAAFMADGYARISGNLGVCCGTSGPGATNLITGVASAYADSVPMLALTAQVATSVFGMGAVQEFTGESLNVVDIFKKVTKYSDVIINEKKACDILVKALKIATTGRTGPVHLNLPADIMKREVSETVERNCAWRPLVHDREGVKMAASLLLGAKKPIIIAGWGAVLSRADVEIQEISELLNIPVATSAKAKGILSEYHPLSLGVLGFAGHPCAKEYILEKDVDVMLAIGTSFNEWMTSGWDKRLHPKEAMIQIDIDPNEIGKNYDITVGIAGDAKIVVRELIYELKRQMNNGAVNGRRKGREIVGLRDAGQSSFKSASSLKSKDGLYRPSELMGDLMRYLPSDTIYFADNGSSMAWAINQLRMRLPYSFFVGMGFASMGYAVAAPLGAKIANPSRPIVTLVGDGSFLMNGMELATAVNHRIPVMWVIMNNSMLGMVYHARKLASIPEGIPSKFKQVDFVKIAEGLGARGIRISRPEELTKKLIDEIIASGKPTVLDVIIDPEEVPPIQSRIETLDKMYK